MVSPGFFETMQVRLVHGRFFDGSDKEGAPSAIVINETFARKYWPNQNPSASAWSSALRARTIPGSRSSAWPATCAAADCIGARAWKCFLSSAQFGGRNLQLLVGPMRPSTGDWLRRCALRFEARSVGADHGVSTVEAEIGESLAVRRFQALLLALFSVLAVLLAAVGIFGLMAQVVVRRTAEIGLRMALGASPKDVLAMVLRQGAAGRRSAQWPASAGRSRWRVC